ncbi:PAS domain S-box protein [bacterium]|nr:PAS domain S-box protein [bacterium]
MDFRPLIENIDLGVVHHLPDGTISYANKAALDIVGLSFDKLRERRAADEKWSAVTSQMNPLDTHNNPVDITLKTGIAQKDVLLGFLPGKGDDYRWIKMSTQAQVSEAGQVTGVFVTFKDVTAQKRAEDQLLASERKSSHLLDCVPDAIFTFDHRGKIVDSNKSFKKLLVLDDEAELWLPQVFEIAVPEPKNADIDWWCRHLKQQRRLKATAGCGSIQVETGLAKYQVGTEEHGICVLKDISQKIASIEALRESENRYKELVEGTHDLVQSVDEYGNFLFVNESWKRRLGYHAHEVNNLKLFDILHADSKEHCKTTFQEVLKGKVVDTMEISLLSKRGERLTVVGNAVPRMRQGKAIATHSFFHDISELKKVENDLRVSERKFRAVVTNLPGMVYRANTDWGVSLIRNAQNLTGYSDADFLQGRVNWFALIVEDDRKQVIENSELLLTQPVSTKHEYRIKRKDGALRWVTDYKTSIFDESGKLSGIDGVVFDSTDSKVAQEKIIEQVRALRRIAYVSAHHTRRPLANIMALLPMLNGEMHQQANLFMQKEVNELDRVIHEVVAMVEGTEG